MDERPKSRVFLQTLDFVSKAETLFFNAEARAALLLSG
jgi:hypothetical protein